MKTQSQELRLEVIGAQQAVMNMESEMEDLHDQHRQEKETMRAEFSKIQTVMVMELAQKEELILELTSKVQELETKIQNVNKDHKERMAKLQEELKKQKALLGEQRIMKAQKKNKNAQEERSLMKQTIKDLSTVLECMRRDQKWIQMLEEQLEDADKQLESEKSARKLESEEMTAKIGKLNEELQHLQEQFAQEQELRNQLNSKYIEMETAQSKSEEEKIQSKRSIQMLEEQLEYAGKLLESEKVARKLEMEAKTAEIGKLNEAYLTELNRLQEQYAQEQQLRNQLNAKLIEMEMARIQSEKDPRKRSV
ncbi:hypothetical protein B9Z55_026349 [Caenorhabditis nigoni]|nr:hypothetical protein B9Z55_026349 [Caenorhabditis nigoni]